MEGRARRSCEPGRRRRPGGEPPFPHASSLPGRDVAVTTSVWMCGLHRAALLREQQVELEKRQQEMVGWSGP